MQHKEENMKKVVAVAVHLKRATPLPHLSFGSVGLPIHNDLGKFQQLLGGG